MAEHTDQSYTGAAHDEAPQADETHHVVPLFVYYRVFAALMVLLVLTLAVAAFDFSRIGLPWVNITVAVTVAVIKAVLVLLYFMHVRYSSRLVWVFASAAFLWLIIMFGLTFSDYFSRNWIAAPGAWTGTVPMD